MIYGYIVVLQSGIFVASNFFGKFKEAEQMDITMVASGIVALSNFFDRLSGEPLENVIIGDYKLAIRYNDDLVVAIFADRNDAIAEGLAKKYLKELTECYKTKCPNIGEFNDSETNEELNSVLDKLNKEIVIINTQAKDMHYLRD